MTEPTARYRINLFWPAEDGCRVADVPDLRFCAAFGETPEAAAPEAQVAVQARLASAAARFHDPEPPRHLRSASDGVGQWLKGEVYPKPPAICRRSIAANAANQRAEEETRSWLRNNPRYQPRRLAPKVSRMRASPKTKPQTVHPNARPLIDLASIWAVQLARRVLEQDWDSARTQPKTAAIAACQGGEGNAPRLRTTALIGGLTLLAMGTTRLHTTLTMPAHPLIRG